MTSTMTSPLKIDRQQQLRKVAILVATLDEPLAERLFADLPAREEHAVREMVESLGEIDPGEYRAVLDDFRRGLSSPTKSVAQPVTTTPRTQLDGVELDPSLLARMADRNVSEEMAATKQSEAQSEAKQKGNPWQTLSEADVSTLVEMLSAEQPQTIAVVLSRLETSRSAELIAQLSPAMQAEVLTRLADLDPADEQTLEVVASQLAQWLTVQRQRHQRMAAGRDLVQRILQDTSDSQRSALLERLGKRNPNLASDLASKLTSTLSVVPRMNATAVRQSPAISVATAYRSSTGMETPPVEKVAEMAAPSADPLGGDHLNELELLDDQALLRALQQAGRQTVMLALAGASESLMKRIVKDLPRRKATQFRQQVRAFGPTRLSDMVTAQRELLRCGQE